MTNEMKDALEAIKKSYKKGYKDATEKAYLWLYETFEVEDYIDMYDVFGEPIFNYERFLNDFQKAMEGNR